MKKLALATAVTAALTAGAANAFNLNHYATGLVVPNVVHNGDDFTTAVGITARQGTTVHWTFFDENSTHVTDGEFVMTENDYHPFIWSKQSGNGLENKRGYLVFTADASGVLTDGDANELISGNAFQVNTRSKDVEFVPTLPLLGNALLNSDATDASTSDYNIPAGGLDLGNMNAGSIRSARMSDVDVGDTIDMRYFVDYTAGGNDTDIVFWFANEINVPAALTVNAYDDNQSRKSVTLKLPNKNQNVVDVETIVGMPSDFTDGFISLYLDPNVGNSHRIGLEVNATTPCTDHYVDENTTGNVTPNCTGGALVYSRIMAPEFGAVQTLLASHD